MQNYFRRKCTTWVLGHILNKCIFNSFYRFNERWSVNEEISRLKWFQLYFCSSYSVLPSALLVNSSLWVQMLRSSCISDFWRFLQGLYELYHRICYFVFVFVIIVPNIQELWAAQHVWTTAYNKTNCFKTISESGYWIRIGTVAFRYMY